MSNMPSESTNGDFDDEPELQPDITLSTPDDQSSVSFSHPVFVDAICRRVHEHFDSTDMPSDFTDAFGPVFAQAIDNVLAKFAKGQKEHGGDIRDRDLEHDETQEIMDLFLYRVTKQTQAKVITIRL